MEFHKPLLSIQKNYRSKLYLIKIFVTDKKLRIQVQESDKCWVGEYSIDFIEILTFKSGSSKKFSVFLNMLMSSLEDTSPSVSICIETHQVLEKIREKPLKGSPSTIYMILTYTSEFDKVLYPLPLTLSSKSLDDTNDSFSSETLDSLREENLQLQQEKQTLSAELKILKAQNKNHEEIIAKLKQKLSSVTSSQNPNYSKITTSKKKPIRSQSTLKSSNNEISSRLSRIADLLSLPQKSCYLYT